MMTIQVSDTFFHDLEKEKEEIYNQSLEDAENRYRKWLKSEYGQETDDDMLTIRVLRSLKIK